MATWFIVAVFALTVPAFIWAIVVAGMVPIATVWWLLLNPLIAPQLLIYVGIYYIVARGITALLWRLPSPKMRSVGIIVIAVLMVWCACQPIFIPITHGSADRMNLARLLGLRTALARTPFEAIGDRDFPAARAAILAAREPFEPDAHSMSPWGYAAEEGWTDILEQIWAKHGGKVPKEQLNSALSLAARDGHADTVRFLLDRGADQYAPALDVAAAGCRFRKF
jgi:hypothetical protein